MPDHIELFHREQLHACLSQVMAGDRAAASQLANEVRPIILRIVRAHVPRREAVEDVTQEVYVKLFKRLHQYRGTAPFGHWLSRITLHACYDHLRAQRRRIEMRCADLGDDGESGWPLIASLVDPRQPSPADMLSKTELIGRLLGALPPLDREIIWSFYFEQRSLAEIGVTTGWSADRVKIRLFRAREKLRRLFVRQESIVNQPGTLRPLGSVARKPRVVRAATRVVPHKLAA